MKLRTDTFGRRLAAIREQRGLTQEQLGAAIGRSRQTVSTWENNETVEIRFRDIAMCARALRCRRADLLAEVEAPLPAHPSAWTSIRRRIARASGYLRPKRKACASQQEIKTRKGASA